MCVSCRNARQRSRVNAAAAAAAGRAVSCLHVAAASRHVITGGADYAVRLVCVCVCVCVCVRW